jgi:Undecaprenyl-phosphate galactose phosphotransferase WbaP
VDTSRLAAAPYAAWKTRSTFLLADAVGLLLIVGVLCLLAIQLWPMDVLFAYQSLAFILPMLFPAYALAGLYRSAPLHPAREIRLTALVTAVVTTTASVSVLLTTQAYAATLLLMGSGLAAALVVPSCRAGFRMLFAQADWWGTPVVVLASGDHGQAVIDTLRRWPELGLRPVALLQDDRADLALDLPVVGPLQWAPALATRHQVPCAIVVMPELSHEERAHVLARHSKFFDQLFVVPEASKGPALWSARSGEGSIVGYDVKHYALQHGARRLKRTVDLVVAALGLIAIAPLMGAIALMIRMDTPGPVFYRQYRMGRDGRCFPVLKFRTMRVDADRVLAEVLDARPALRREYEQYHKLADDPRVTTIGRVLRRYSLDELPQLWNVLRGDMSLVGPRAYMPSELPKMKGLAAAVLQTPPGITGLWQVSGRNHLSFAHRVDLDVHYIQNWTPWLDWYIFIRTFPVVFAGDGAS